MTRLPPPATGLALGCLCASAVLLPWAGAARADTAAPALGSLPASIVLGTEAVRLPRSERMGLVGVSYLLELQPGWHVGPSLYGAATGQRGGLFTWGAEVQRRWRFGERWSARAGLYVGGGGGASAPVGGGLMLRPHVDAMVDLGGWQLGLSASHVRFSGGAIESSQLGLVLSIDDRFSYARPGHGGRSAAAPGGRGLAIDRLELLVGSHRPREDRGQGSFGTLGLRLEHDLGPHFVASVEAAAAVSGQADGYMEVLAGMGVYPLVLPQLAVGARLAVGLAGGGGAGTGGGIVAKASLAARWRVAPGWSVQLEAGRSKARDGRFGGRNIQLALAVPLAGVADDSGRRTLHETEWSFNALRYLRASRKAAPAQPLTLLGLGFSRALTPHAYVSGQAHSAVAGGAGAFSVALVGAGLRTGLGFMPGVSVGVEALVGAAGGGGVATAGGVVVQPAAWIEHRTGRHAALRLALGRIEATRDALSSTVLQVSWGLRFDAP